MLITSTVIIIFIMKTFAVYKIHNIETNMDYIGWSGDPINRIFKQHENTNSYIGNAICVYGWDVFDVDVLYLVKTKEEACKLEIEEIAKHNCQAPNGYNLTAGGDGIVGFKPTKESIEKMKRNLPDRHGKNNPMYGTKGGFAGKKHSKKSGKKIGIANSKRIWSKESKKKSSQNHKGKNLGNQFAKGKNLGKKNVAHRIDVKYKRLRTRLKKLEKEINEELGDK